MLRSLGRLLIREAQRSGKPARRFLAASSTRIQLTAGASNWYIAHAWIWKHNPAGMFADWNPEVSCP